MREGFAEGWGVVAVRTALLLKSKLFGCARVVLQMCEGMEG